MAGKRILTIFGATGKQGGSVIQTVLAHPDLQQKYALRGITRDPSSSKSQALTSKGVEMVSGELDDLDSLKKAIAGSYGVFGVTDFWAHLDKDREIQQGKNIFEAAKSANVKHFVWSALARAENITNGELKHVEHFDSKAIVADYVEANKGEMIASHFMPAMFINFAKTMIKPVDGKPTLSLPFPSDSIAWPLLDADRDGGKYVMGLFEGENKANGVFVQGVSTWTTPKEVVDTLSQESGKEVGFNPIPREVFAGFFPENIRDEFAEMMDFIGRWSYYGKGTEKKQEESNRWLVDGTKTISFPQWAKENGPWTF